MLRPARILMSVVAAGLLLPAASTAQDYPSKPVRVIVPFPPGGVDVLARVITTAMTDTMGQPVVLENRAGANGIIGSEFVMRSEPDGYTLLVTTSSTLVTSLFLSKNVPFHPIRDFTPIGAMYEGVQTLAVRGGLPVNSLTELIDHAKRNPGKLSYATSGIGSAFHMHGEAFKQMAGVDILHVPYKGTGPVARALIVGEIDMAFPSFGNLGGNVSKVKILAINGPKRYERYPAIPAITEVLPQFRRIPGWIALFGPAGVPDPIVARANAGMLKALRSPAVKAALDKQDSVDIGGTPQELAQDVKETIEITAALVKLVGVKPE